MSEKEWECETAAAMKEFANGQATEPTIEDRLKALEARLSDVEARRREIEASAGKVDKLALVLAKKEAERKAAKTAWEEAVEAHMSLSRHWSKSEEVASRPLIKACEAKADPIPADDSWREEPIEVLQAFGLSEGIVEKLGELGFATLGDLSKWVEDGNRFDHIDSLGRAKAKKIEGAVSAYWDARAADVQDADDAEEDDLDAAEDVEAVADERLWTDEHEFVADSTPPMNEEEFAASQERSGLDLVTSRPDSDPESNGVETTEAKPKRRRKAKA